jgi:hypothetical protein
MKNLERLKKILREHNSEFCPKCGHEIGFGDIAWNEGSTSEGTPTSWFHIQCINCQKEIAWFSSWYPHDVNDEEDLELLLRVLEEDWKQE